MLVLQGLGGGCGHDPRATATETASTVEIRVRQLMPADLSAIKCPAMARIDVLRVRLSAPIAGRALVRQSLGTATVGLSGRRTVPRVVGLRAADARFALRAQGFRVRGPLDGVVRGQQPRPKSPVRAEQVTVTLASAPAAARIPPLRPVPFRTIARGDGAADGLRKRAGLVVKTENRWRKVWRSLGTGHAEPPRIDFSRHMLLVAAQGRQPSGGHRVRITGVGDTGGFLIADVDEVSPGNGCISPGVITSPYHVVRVRRGDERVQFARHPREKRCD